MTTTALKPQDKFIETITKLDMSVSSVIGSDKAEGFEKAFVVSKAIGELKEILRPEYMKPIMALQNNRLGFKTDKKDGYSEEEVKNCLIEAVLMGFQPVGNQFNIIAGQTYGTKEGFGYLLNKIKGLEYSITFELPRMNEKSAAVAAIVKWKIAGKEGNQRLDIPVKVNAYMGADAVLGKATRKARKWLHDNLTGTDYGDGDTQDIPHTVIEITVEELNGLYEMKQGFLTPEEKKDAERIISSQEATSYKKLQALLMSK